jgi:hypothetical protein
MDRKQAACAAAGVLFGAIGCSSTLKSLTVPAGNEEGAAATSREAHSVRDAPHVTEVLLSLISGTKEDIGTAVFRLAPDHGWSITSDHPRLHVEIQRGHVAIVTAPENKKVQFVATATISHADGAHFDVRCHVEAGCNGAVRE